MGYTKAITNTKGGSSMASTNINVRTDTLLKAKAQAVLESVGLDMSTAINVFLHQIVNKNGIPFEISTPEKKPIEFGKFKGEIWMADDFDAPMEEFEEYM
jgi:DNA-damage-inducible protein J